MRRRLMAVEKEAMRAMKDMNNNSTSLIVQEISHFVTKRGVARLAKVPNQREFTSCVYIFDTLERDLNKAYDESYIPLLILVPYASIFSLSHLSMHPTDHDSPEVQCCNPNDDPSINCPDIYGSYDNCWDEGGYCCSDGNWYADPGDGSGSCMDWGLVDSEACPFTDMPTNEPTHMLTHE